MLRGLGAERFHTLTREQACVVLQPSFIAQQNLMLGYDFTTEAESLNTREIQALACLDNPEGHGSPWWLDVQSYDTFLAGFTHVHRNENDVRRSLLQISCQHRYMYCCSERDTLVCCRMADRVTG